jgi:AcrR family transcriptional regulator
MDRARIPRQKRSEATLSRLVDAARRLLAEKPFDDITINEIVAEAGASVGSFYARFGDKEALLEHLSVTAAREADDEVRQTLASRDWESAPLEIVARELVRGLVRQHRAHTGTLRAMASRRILNRFGSVREGGGSLPPPVLAEIIKRRRSEIAHPNPDVAVHLGLAMVTSTVRDRVLFPELSADVPAPSPVTDAVFADELTRAFLGFLGVNPAGRPR